MTAVSSIPSAGRVVLRFCERDVHAPCSVCRDYTEARALEFFDTSEGHLLCEACALSRGVSVPDWRAFVVGAWFEQ